MLRPLGRLTDPARTLATPREQIAPDHFDPGDTWLMVQAWNAGTPACRDVALELADRNREAARRTS